MSERIEVNGKVRFGKPCVAGTRIAVVEVLELLGCGLTFEDILRDHYPDLSREDIQACLRYAMEVIGAEDVDIPSGSWTSCGSGNSPPRPDERV